jgi:Tfp pilus assembly protein PilF
MNDFESAQQSFKRALSYNGSDPTALWGLAALYKNFEFANKYSQALSKATKSGRPTGVIHPWVQALLGDST